MAVLEVMLVVIIMGCGHDFAEPYIGRIGACVVLFAVVDLFKTLSCRLLSLRVNSGNLFNLLQVRHCSLTALAAPMRGRSFAGGSPNKLRLCHLLSFRGSLLQCPTWTFTSAWRFRA